MMNTPLYSSQHDLLRRIETLAVEVAELRTQLEQATKQINSIPQLVQAAEKQLLVGMANGAVNCGDAYGCSLAQRYLHY